ncbi:hypothetical protein WMY93_026339 [Mugilogobius chulae]|uniref:L1 transposable element RRM domain-containing protein n=1 Tax=Mugilogobius chulae TaxID=88201 RepID=A0AAW0N1N9_9GOBI
MPRTRATKQSMEEALTSSLVTEAHLEATLKKFFNKAEKHSEARFERLENQLSAIENTLSKHGEAIEKQASDISSIDSRVTDNEDAISQLKDALAKTEQKLVSLEDRDRRENLRIMNIKEGEEKGNMLSYLSLNIPKWFPALAGSPPELMRAHRLGPPSQSSKPRIILVRCLRFTDRDRILTEARKTSVQVADRQINVAPDYSDFTAKKRRPCYPVMHRARTLGFQAFLLYPATIKLIKGTEQHLFNNPSDSEKFLSDYEASKAP